MEVGDYLVIESCVFLEATEFGQWNYCLQRFD